MSHLRRRGDQRERDRLALVGDCRHSQQRSDLVSRAVGAREGGPLHDPGVGVAGRQIGQRDLTRFGPAAGERERQREVLAGFGIGVGRAGGGHQHLDPGGGVAGKRHREAAVGGCDGGDVGVEELLRAREIAGRGGRQRIIERRAALARIELQRVGERLARGHEPARAQIGLAEQRTVGRVLRAQLDRLLGEADREVGLALGERDVGGAGVALGRLEGRFGRRAALHRGGGGGQDRERQRRATRLQPRLQHGLGHLHFSPEKRWVAPAGTWRASASTCGCEFRKASSAATTSCCDDRPATALARRRRR